VIIIKTLIVYGSRYGTVEKAVDHIAGKLIEKPDIMTAGKAAKACLDGYDKIIIGGSVMMGKINKSVTAFIINKMDVLMTKKTALFIAGSETDKDGLAKEINDAFPKQLRDRAMYTTHIGYGFNLENMNFIVRMMIRKAANIESSVMNLNYEELDKIANIING
jgi:menaquinone-dependent protoporphyrinogen oxidase